MIKLKERTNHALCSYCEKMATYRVSCPDYELYACTPHHEVADTEFDLINGRQAWRKSNTSSLGFPPRKEY